MIINTTNKNYIRKFRYIIILLLLLQLIGIIAGPSMFGSGLGTSEYGSYTGIYIYGFGGLFLLLLVHGFININQIGRTINYLNKLYYNYITLFFFFIVFQVLQFIILSNLRALLIVPKYMFFLLIIVFSSVWGIKFVKNNLGFLNKIGILLCLIFISLYTIYFLQDPIVSAFRENRYFILLGNAVEDGGFFSVFFPFLLFSKMNKRYIKNVLITLFMFFMIFYNGTRSSLIAVLISLLIFLSYKKIAPKKLLFIVIIFIGFILIIPNAREKIVSYDSAFSIQGIVNAWSGDYSGNLAIRIGNIWAPMIKHTIQNSPIIGFGNGSWAVQSREVGFLSSNMKYYRYERSPHNAFLVYYVDWGIFGLLFMLFFFYKGFSENYRISRIRTNIDLMQYGNIGLCAWISFILWCLTGNAHNWSGWTVFAYLNIYTIALKEYYENTMALSVSNRTSCS